MLEYVEKLTVTPWDVSEDVNLLREAGFTNRDVLDICEIASYYAYVNRIADGLGVKLETWIADES
jgi:alkylhydroperoxidase family enzyme